MPFDNVAKNAMLDFLATLDDPHEISLHDGDPGASNDNETTAGREAPTWDTASGGDMALAAPVLFTGGAPSGDVLWFAVWKSDGTTRLAKAEILSGDVAFNVSGEYTLTVGTRLRITDS